MSSRSATLWLVMGACSGIPLPADLDQAQILERTGRNDEAALAAWRKIRASCKPPKSRPHDDCGLAATREAQLLERLDRLPEAAEAWAQMPSRSSDPRKTAHALSRAAELQLGLGHRALALELAWRSVEAFPDEVPADDALALIFHTERQRDPSALRDRFDTLIARFAKTDLADNLIFDAAELAEVELQDGEGAVRRYDELVRRFPRSPLADKSMWKAAELLRKRGDGQGALQRLDRLLRTRKDALIVGSYNSLLLDDAQLLEGQIWRDDLHDSARAVDAFQHLIDDFPDSTLRDDALYEMAVTLEKGGHRTRACAALGRLAREFPDGNRARAGAELGGKLGCGATLQGH